MLLPNFPLRTAGGHVWWRTLDERFGWKLQQNVLTEHFRILDLANVRQAWSMEKSTIRATFQRFISRS